MSRSKAFFFSLILIGASGTIPAEEKNRSLDDLFRQIKKELSREEQEHIKREQRFRSQLDKQATVLKQAQQELVRQQTINKKLKKQYELNEREIEAQSGILKERGGTLLKLHGVVRKISNEIDSIIDTSIITAQNPERDILLGKLAASTELPSTNELEDLWVLVLEELTESSKIVTFKSQVITKSGDEQERTVTRVGAFNAVSGGRFLRYLPETKKLLEPAGQPPPRLQKLAAEFETGGANIHPFPIDPTRGARLALYILEPDVKKRIEQGGLVGYIIIIVAIIGLGIALFRFIVLGMMEKKIKNQLKTEQPGDNPLGRIIQIYKDNPDIDTKTLECKLDETILKELPELQRGLGTLALLASIAPLLGLLGTVTGIIATFQSITLYGTGDPQVMSDGISQALVTTVMGLVVAIPLLLLHGFLSTRSNRLGHLLDEKSKNFIAQLAENQSISR